jgi:hypothetical protein
MGTRILGTRTFGTRIFGIKPRPANTDPWTLERRLHLALAAVAVMGWVLAYTALTRGIDGAQDTARSEGAGMKVTANLTP